MSPTLSPIVSEFETEEQAASYDRWLRAKVQASRNDSRPSVPHDQAMAQVRERLEKKIAERKSGARVSRSRDR